MQASYGMIIFPFWYLDQIKEKKNYWNVQSSTTENCNACSLCGNYSNFVTTQEVKNRPISTPYTIYWCCGYFLTINFTPWNYEFTSFSIPSVSNKETLWLYFSTIEGRERQRTWTQDVAFVARLRVERQIQPVRI